VFELQVTVEDDAESKRRKSYGRGLFDALRMVGIDDPEKFMNEAKLHKAEQGVTGIEAKVLAAVPIEEQWNRHQVMAEMRRLTGANADPHVVDGCLHHLIGRGLVKEVAPGEFKRIKPREPRVWLAANGQPTPVAQAAAEAVDTDPVIVAMQASAPSQIKDPLELGAFAQRLRGLADDIDAMGIALAERMQRAQLEGERLRQLRSLLSSINEDAT